MTNKNSILKCVVATITCLVFFNAESFGANAGTCASPTSITTFGTATGALTLATTATTSPPYATCNATNKSEGWAQFTASATLYDIDVTTISKTTAMQVFDETAASPCTATATPVLCVASVTAGASNLLTTTSGHTYFIRFIATQTANSSANVTVFNVAGTCASPTALTLGTATGTLALGQAATTTPVATTCSATNDGEGWYSLTADATASMIDMTAISNAVAIQVFAGAPCGGADPIYCGTVPSGGAPAFHWFYTTPGTIYWVRIFGTTTGTTTCNITAYNAVQCPVDPCTNGTGSVESNVITPGNIVIGYTGSLDINGYAKFDITTIPTGATVAVAAPFFTIEQNNAVSGSTAEITSTTTSDPCTLGTNGTSITFGTDIFGPFTVTSGTSTVLAGTEFCNLTVISGLQTAVTGGAGFWNILWGAQSWGSSTADNVTIYGNSAGADAPYLWVAYTGGSCTIPGAPTTVSGTSTGPNTATGSWAAGSPAGSASVTYNWYVSTSSSGVCSPTTSVVYYSPGTSSWPCPAGVTSVNVQAWGAGGAGGSAKATTTVSGGSGGAGGSYAKGTNISVSNPNSYAVVVGAGGTGVSQANGNPGGSSSFNGTTVVAVGGAGGNYALNGVGAATAGSTTGNAGSGFEAGGGGGAGVSAAPAGGGGGGGGAGTTGPGQTASTIELGWGGVNGGGNGAYGPTSTNAIVAGSSGSEPGGGGSGTVAANTGTGLAGGAGGAGQVIITYNNPAVVASGSTASTSASITGLTCNTTYYLTVSATTSCNGATSTCTTSSAFTTGSCCTPPTLTAEANGSTGTVTASGSSSVTLTANPSGQSGCSGTWNYAWSNDGGTTFWNGTAFSGGASYNSSYSSISFTTGSSNNTTTYTAYAQCSSNTGCASTTSTVSVQTLIGCAAPTITAEANGTASSLTISYGATVALTANPAGGGDCSGSFQYAWSDDGGTTFWNGSAFSGSASYSTSYSSISLSNVTAGATYTAYVQCSANTACNGSSAVTVTVGTCSAPTLTAKANGTSGTYTACSGTAVTLTANASGGAYCSGNYAWFNGSNYWNGSAFSSATSVYSSSYSSIAITSGASTTYTCYVQCTNPSCNNSSAVNVYITAPTAPVLANFGGSQQLAFNNAEINTTQPYFLETVATSSCGNYNTFYIDINTNSTFTGTDYNQTYTGTYVAGTAYNFQFTNGIPSTNGVTYYVRVKAAADGGTNWSAWSSGTYSLTYTSTAGNPFWYQTTQAQFQSDVLSGLTATSGSGVQLTSTASSNEVTNGNFATGTLGSWTSTVVQNGGGVSTAHYMGIATATTPSSIDGNSFNPPSPAPVSSGYCAIMCNDADGFSESESAGYYILTQTGVNLSNVSTITFNQTIADWGIGGCSGMEESSSKLEVIIDPSNSSGSTINGNVVYTSTTLTGQCLQDPANGGSTISTGPTLITINLPAGTYGTANSIKFVWNSITATSSVAADAPTVYVANIAANSVPSGTITSSTINLSSIVGATKWNNLYWNQTQNGGTITLAVQQYTGGAWANISGYTAITSATDGANTFSLSGLATTIDSIRIVATLTTTGGGTSPSLNSWSVDGVVPTCLDGPVYTVGSGYNYSNLTAAFTALQNSLVCANLVFELEPNYVSTSETLPLALNTLNYGAGGPYTVTFEPAPSVTSPLTTTGSESSSALITLNGVSNIIFDGRAGGSSATSAAQDWIIQNSAQSGGPAIEMTGGADNNILKYLNIQSSDQTTTSGTVYLYCGSTGPNNTGDSINNCNIGPYGTSSTYFHYNGICAYGYAPYANSTITVLNNDIHDFITQDASPGSNGILVSGTNAGTDYGDHWTISGNSFYRSFNTNILYYDDYYQDIPINFIPSPSANASTGNVISNNYIGGSYSAHTNNAISGTWYTACNASISDVADFQGITVSASAATISGNVIGGVFNEFASSTGATGGFVGIYIPTASTSGSYTISGNTIGSTHGAGNMYLTTSTSSVTPGTGSQTFTVAAGLPYQVGDTVRITSQSATGPGSVYTAWMEGPVTSYSGTTLVVNVIRDLGFGSAISAWNITLAGSSVEWAESAWTTGIWVNMNGANSTTCSITGNTIGNLYGTANSYSGVEGIVTQNGTYSITGNSIYNLGSNFVNNAGNQELYIGTYGSITGISQQGITNGVQTISQNSVYNLYSIASGSSANAIYGMYLNGVVSGTTYLHIANANSIYNLAVPNTATGTLVYGIYMSTGVWELSNNIVQLGISSVGSITGDIDIEGITDGESTASATSSFPQKIYNNTINIDGTGIGSGSNNTYCWKRNNANDYVDVRDNIFVNNRSNTSSGSNYNFSIGYTSTGDLTASSQEDYNDYYGTGTGYVLAYVGANETTIAGIQGVTQSTFDVHSILTNPQFISPDVATPNLGIGSSSPMIGAGTTSLLSGVTKDFYGSTRTTPVTIGAVVNSDPNDAGITAIPSTTDLCPGTQTVTATIYNYGTSTLTSVDVNWSVDGTSQTQAVFTGLSVAQGSSITETLGTYNFTAGSHTIVAATTLPNGVTDGNPANDSYTTTVYASLPSTVYVGSGSGTPAFATFSALFTAINSNTLSQNLNVIVQGNTTEPATPVFLNAVDYCTGGPYWIYIRPASATAYTISGTTGTSGLPGMIGFSGASRVYIDGEYNGDGIQHFTFTNSASYPVISYINNATYITIKNSIITGSVNSSSYGLVNIGAGVTSGGATGNSNLKIAYNTIGNSSSLLYNIIYSNGISGALNTTDTILANSIFNFQGATTTAGNGINVTATGNGGNWVIDSNSIYNTLTTTSSVQTAINFVPGASANGSKINYNYIGGSAAQCGGSAAWVNSWSPTATANVDYGIALSTGTVIVDSNLIKRVWINDAYNSAFDAIEITNSTAATVVGNTIGGTVQAVFDNSPTTADLIEVEGGAASTYPGSAYGIYATGSGASYIDSNVFNIIVQNGATKGGQAVPIAYASSGTATIMGNTINHAECWGISYSDYGIYLTPAGSSSGNVIANNVIEGVLVDNSGSSTEDDLGILVSINNSLTVSGSIYGNIIWGVTSNEVGGSTEGIEVEMTTASGTGAGNWNIYNNMIYLNNNAATNSAEVDGIDVELGPSSTTNVFYNSVWIDGTNSSASNSSSALLRLANESGSAAGDVFKARNNILINTRTGGTFNAAIDNYGSSSSIATNFSSNDNFLFNSGGSDNYLGYWKTTTESNLSAWQGSSASNGDANSYTATYTSGSSSFSGGTLNPTDLFTLSVPADLSINTSDGQSNLFVADRGTPITTGAGYSINVSTDINGTTRNASTPDIGAYEFVASALPTILASPTSLSAFSTTYGTASATQTFSASGTNLTANILVTAPAGFLVSTSPTSGFGSTVTLNESGGTVTATTIYVELAPTAAAGTYSGESVALTSTGATTVDVTIASSTVTTAALTITASAQSQTYGTALSLGTSEFTTSALQNGETVGSVTLKVGGSTTSPATTPVGTYTITPSSATGGTFNASNYNITYVTGTLTVSQANLTITASAQSQTYGTALNLGTSEFTTSALQNGETVGSVTLKVGGSTTSPATTPVGTYTITPSSATGGTFNASNYNITYATGTLTVSQANLTITASAQSQTYGTALNLGTSEFTTSALQNGETVGSVTLKVGGSTTSPATTPVGTYTITPSSATGGTFNASNYNITYVTGTLTVSQANLTITASAQSQTYGAALNLGTSEFTTSALQNGETVGSVTLEVGGLTTSPATTPVGTYTITPSSATGGTFNASNYNITYATGTLTVSQANLTITASAQSQTYGTALNLGTSEFTTSALQNGETVGSVTLKVGGSTTSPATTPVGTYTITPSSATGGTFNASNYNITYATGTLTVGQANLTITANSTTKCYGQTVTFDGTEFTITSGILYNGDNVTSVTLSSSGASSGASVGGSPYTIVPSAAVGSGLSNYSITYDNGSLTVYALPAPSFIAAPTPVCNDSTGNVYTTQSGQSNYIWSVIGGTITSGGGTSDNTATVSWTSSGSESISINYNNNNNCAAASPTAQSITVYALPNVYDVTGGACVPADMGVSGSDMGVNYQLYRNNTIAVGSPLPGTGHPIDFGDQSTAGTYSVIATNATTGCYVSMTGVSTVNICTSTWVGGSTDSSWTNQTNWNPEAVPNLCAANVIIPSGVAHYPIISGADVSVGNVSMAGGTTITLQGQNLNVCGNWTGGSGGNAAVVGSGTVFLNSTTGAQTISGNTQFPILQINNGQGGVTLTSGAIVAISTGLHLQSGNVNISAGTLHLLSTASNSNSYIDDFTTGFTGTLTGNTVIADRYVPVIGFNQHFISSPVNTPSFSQLRASGPDGSYVVPFTGCDEYQSDYNSPYGTVFQYNDGHAASGDCMLGNWQIRSEGNLVNALGYSTYLTGDSTLSLTGTANTGDLSVGNLNNSGYPTVNTLQGDPIESGWNLVGNPYPSAISLSISRDAAGFQNQILLWVTDGPFEGSWQYAVIDSPAENTITIAPFQAFMVRVKPGSTGIHSYPFYQSERVRTTNASFYRTQLDNTLDMNLTYNGMTDVTTVSFRPNATNTFDDLYDANKQDGAQGRPTLYTTMNDNHWYALNCVPPLTQQVATIPMGLHTEATGTMTLTPQGIESFDPTTYIYLEDQQTGTWQNLRNGAYTFNANINDAQNRFVLHFTPPAEILTRSANCNTTGLITISQPGSASWSFVITNASNNIVATGTLNQANQVIVDANAGVYTVTLTDSTGYTVIKNIQVGGAEAITASFTASATTAQTAQPVSFNSAAESGADYSWNFGDGTTATGQDVTHDFTTPGVYTVQLTVTNAGGCTSTTTRVITVTGTATGIANVTGNGQLKIWSNENRVYVDFSNETSVDARVDIYDILGQLLSSEKFGKSTLYSKEIDNMDAEYLVIQVNNEGEVTTKKVFIANINK